MPESVDLHPDVVKAITELANSKLGRRYDAYARKEFGLSGATLAGKTVAGEFGGRSTKTGRGVVSSAGARGPAQFIASTRRAYIDKYGYDPWANDRSAIRGLMQHQLDTGVAGYNPGMPTYTKYITSQKLNADDLQTLRGSKAQSLQSGGQVSLTGPSNPGLSTRTIPAQSFAAERQDVRRDLLLSGGGLTMDKLLSYKRSVNSLQDVPASTEQVLGKIQTPKVNVSSGNPQDSDDNGTQPLGGGGKGSFKVQGNMNRLAPQLRTYANKVARIAGMSFEGPDGSTHSRLTVNGKVSEHSTGNAVDIFTIDGQPAVGRRLIRAGQAALIAAGMPRAKALKQTGGLYNVGNHQIIFNVDGIQNGGNHKDHLHISAR